MDDGPLLHILASLVSGLVTTTVSSPADVIKTRIMAAKSNAAYKNSFQCALRSIQADGWAVLFRGWVPNYMRIGPHSIMALPLCEQLRYLFGVGYL
mmetsp:Transcript_11052/g.12155  ORF Transcript_11052/g.12155 Transcript_11052/m.12155 type:complete len:96 (-) Transcript_11052:101-388(-)